LMITTLAAIGFFTIISRRNPSSSSATTDERNLPKSLTTQLQYSRMGQSRHANKVTARGKWSIDTRLTAQVVGSYALIIVLAALLFRGPRQVEKLLVKGTVQATRIVPDYALEAPGGSQLTWKAEFRVAYSVANREYLVWAESGIRGDSEVDVRLRLPRSYPPCRVQCDLQRPEVSVAYCR
jgi:hypothetical protein